MLKSCRLLGNFIPHHKCEAQTNSTGNKYAHCLFTKELKLYYFRYQGDIYIIYIYLHIHSTSYWLPATKKLWNIPYIYNSLLPISWNHHTFLQLPRAKFTTLISSKGFSKMYTYSMATFIRIQQTHARNHSWEDDAIGYLLKHEIHCGGSMTSIFTLPKKALLCWV